MASLTVESNFNFNLSGTSNRGIIRNNGNLLASSCQSELILSNNSNGSFNVERSTFVASNNSNFIVNGKDNVLNLNSNSNINIYGNENNCQLDSNSNFKFNGNHSKVKFFGNSNIKVDGSYNDITAFSDSNLTINGNKNVLSINDTSNHEVTCVQDDTNATNIVEIIPNWGNVKYSVAYIKEANINKHYYKVGIFKFIMIPQNMGKQIQVLFNDFEIDTGTFEAKQEGLDTMLFSACKDGRKQHLLIVGPEADVSKPRLVEIRTLVST